MISITGKTTTLGGSRSLSRISTGVTVSLPASRPPPESAAKGEFAVYRRGHVIAGDEAGLADIDLEIDDRRRIFAERDSAPGPDAAAARRHPRQRDPGGPLAEIGAAADAGDEGAGDEILINPIFDGQRARRLRPGNGAAEAHVAGEPPGEALIRQAQGFGNTSKIAANPDFAGQWPRGGHLNIKRTGHQANWKAQRRRQYRRRGGAGIAHIHVQINSPFAETRLHIRVDRRRRDCLAGGEAEMRNRKRRSAMNHAAACRQLTCAAERAVDRCGRQPAAQDRNRQPVEVKDGGGASGSQLEPARQPARTDGEIEIIDQQPAAAAGDDAQRRRQRQRVSAGDPVEGRHGDRRLIGGKADAAGNRKVIEPAGGPVEGEPHVDRIERTLRPERERKRPLAADADGGRAGARVQARRGERIIPPHGRLDTTDADRFALRIGENKRRSLQPDVDGLPPGGSRQRDLGVCLSAQPGFAERNA